MLATAAGYALLAALTPAAILVCAAYLGSDNPHRTMAFFLAGAIAMTVITGIAILVALRAGGLSLRHNHAPRYGLRLGLGAAALTGAVVMVVRRRRAPADRKAKKPGLVSRMMARPGPLAAFTTGVIVFLPSGAFVAAVQTIATSRDSVAATALTLAAVIVIDVILIWLPFAFYLVAPDLTTRKLKAFNEWLRAHGRTIVTAVLVVTGLLLIYDGLSGLL